MLFLPLKSVVELWGSTLAEARKGSVTCHDSQGDMLPNSSVFTKYQPANMEVPLLPAKMVIMA